MTGWCDNCNHRLSWHGDRAIGGLCIGGTTNAGVYPAICDCDEYREGTAVDNSETCQEGAA